mmetsp:Transcript_18487/g.47304  ORF Transcript_18487/g.47304 Transcript_18487/m.47304 type:complete len:230 (+) Transcript_18487:842-1531(+)
MEDAITASPTVPLSLGESRRSHGGYAGYSPRVNSSSNSIEGTPDFASCAPSAELVFTSAMETFHLCTQSPMGNTSKPARPVMLSRTSCVSSVIKIFDDSVEENMNRSEAGMASLPIELPPASSSASSCAHCSRQRRCSNSSALSVASPWSSANSSDASSISDTSSSPSRLAMARASSIPSTSTPTVAASVSTSEPRCELSACEAFTSSRVSTSIPCVPSSAASRADEWG